MRYVLVYHIKARVANENFGFVTLVFLIYLNVMSNEKCKSLMITFCSYLAGCCCILIAIPIIFVGLATIEFIIGFFFIALGIFICCCGCSICGYGTVIQQDLEQGERTAEKKIIG